MTQSTLITTEAVSRFLFEEARRLDAHDYDSWLELWLEDGYYWMPSDGATSPDSQVAIISDNFRRLVMRVRQLQTGYRYAQLPQSTTQHFITNVMVSEGEAENEVTVNSSYLVIEARFGDVQFWPGAATHVLRATDDSELRISRKTFRLINNDLPLPSMGFLP